MLQGIERYLKQAIVDKNASVSSASLVSALVSFLLSYMYKTAYSETSIKGTPSGQMRSVPLIALIRYKDYMSLILPGQKYVSPKGGVPK